jgi:hypothetical protein
MRIFDHFPSLTAATVSKEGRRKNKLPNLCLISPLELHDEDDFRTLSIEEDWWLPLCSAAESENLRGRISSGLLPTQEEDCVRMLSWTKEG